MGGIELGLLNPYLGSIYALIAGILTSASPCSIAAVPLIVGHMAGSSVDSKTLDLLLFLTGMTLVQSAVGMVAGLLGQSLVLTVPWIRWISGLAFILGGLTYMGFIGRGNTCKVKLPLGESQPNGSLRRRLFASLGMGALYSLSASPCSTPALFAILGLVTSSGSVGKGALLLFFYSIGQSFLVAAAGLFTSRLKAFLEIEKNIGALEYMRKIGGLFIALLGLYVILRPHI